MAVTGNHIEVIPHLIGKYGTAGPRYTSYPTAPQWSDRIGSADYLSALGRVDEKDALSLYLHLPFCEKLCYYCGCNIQITGDKRRSLPYVQAVLAELRMLGAALESRRELVQISWGGGTPTFLSLDEIEQLWTGIAEVFDIHSAAEISIEVDPRVTTQDQLRLLRRLGFNRVSLGVQDFDSKVQDAVNRGQTFEQTRDLLAFSRSLGFRGINFDLIYGLPHQTRASFSATVDKVVELRPDRIALYNYARLPQLLKHQGILEEFPMPSADERVAIFLSALARLSGEGYEAIGMDHFALHDDGLFGALQAGTLYRNFMGYTVRQSSHLIGVGASAIGEVAGGFFQNLKKASEYESRILSGNLATARGLLLVEDDRRRQWVIQSLMCRFELDSSAFETRFGASFRRIFEAEIEGLEPFWKDGIIEGSREHLKVTDLGRLFVRNVAMVFDAYLGKNQAPFSQTI